MPSPVSSNKHLHFLNYDLIIRASIGFQTKIYIFGNFIASNNGRFGKVSSISACSRRQSERFFNTGLQVKFWTLLDIFLTGLLHIFISRYIIQCHCQGGSSLRDIESKLLIFILSAKIVTPLTASIPPKNISNKTKCTSVSDKFEFILMARTKVLFSCRVCLKDSLIKLKITNKIVGIKH